MAPEVMCRQNHGVPADYFAVGVIAYECMNGKRPYQGKSRKEIREQILAKQASIRRVDLPEGWSFESMDFINKVHYNKHNTKAASKKAGGKIGIAWGRGGKKPSVVQWLPVGCAE